MAMQITRWSPDTCQCVVEYAWDDTTSESTRTHTIANVVSRCTLHATLTDMTAHFTVLMDENPRKNKLIGWLVTQFSSLTTTDPQGNITLKDGIVTWFYDASRVLQFTIPSLTQNQKNTAQSWCNTNLGVGKVKIN